MRLRILLILTLITIPLILSGAEKSVNDNLENDIVPYKFNGIDGFWVSPWVLNQYNLINEYHNFTWNVLGMNEENYERRLKDYRKMDITNKILIGACVGGGFVILSAILSIVIYCILSFAERGIVFKEI